MAVPHCNNFEGKEAKNTRMQVACENKSITSFKIVFHSNPFHLHCHKDYCDSHFRTVISRGLGEDD